MVGVMTYTRLLRMVGLGIGAGNVKEWKSREVR